MAVHPQYQAYRRSVPMLLPSGVAQRRQSTRFALRD